MKRLLSVLLAVVMLFSFAACTGESGGGSGSGAAGEREFTTGYDEEKYNAPGTYPIFKEKQQISLMVSDNQYIEDWDTNKQTLLIEERLNADLTINVMPNKEYNTKINLMAAAGGEEFPDMILGSFSDGMVMNLADSEVVVPITDYVYNKDIVPNMYEAIDRLGWDYYPYITMLDGEIYGVPTINDSISQPYSCKMWFYKPWFDAAGIDIYDIHTTEDFKNALLQVVKSDPNGNGKADEVGISYYASSNRWFVYLMNAFIYAGDSDYYYVKDGELGFAFQRDEWKQGLEYMKELYDLGLIDPLIFSQDSASYKAMLNYEDTIVTAFCSINPDSVAQDDPRRTEYRCINPLNSAWNGGKPLSRETLPEPTTSSLISVNAADPELGVRMSDLMVSEELSVHTRWGEEGVDWLHPAEDDVSMYASLGYEPYLIEVLPYSVPQNSHWQGKGPVIRHKAISAGVVWSGNPSDTNYTIAEGQLLYNETGPEENIVKLIFTEEENEIVTNTLPTITTYVEEMSAKFINGTEDLNTGWETFQEKLEVMGTAQVLECAQAAYDRLEK